MKLFKNDWNEFLDPETDKEYYQKLRKFLYREYKTGYV